MFSESSGGTAGWSHAVNTINITPTSKPPTHFIIANILVVKQH